MLTDSNTKEEALDNDDGVRKNDIGRLFTDQSDTHETSVESNSVASPINDNESITDDAVYTKTLPLSQQNEITENMPKWPPPSLAYQHSHRSNIQNEIDRNTEEWSHVPTHLPQNEIDKNKEKWPPSPFSVKKSWNYRTVLNEKTQTRMKISRKNKVNKTKFKKPRIGILHSKNEISSQYGNKVLKKREKNSKSDLSKRRFLQKYRKKIGLDCVKDVFNGLSPNNDASITFKKIEVPNESPIEAEQDERKSEIVLEEDDDVEVDEYAQYLELKPTVKFKCYLCGANDFSTIALLQEHISSCTGKSSTSVTPSSPLRSKRPLVSTSTASPNLRITRKVFLCSSCGTYYQNYNLYIHMRDKHNKQICLFCRNIFSKPQQLWDHLVAAHNLNSVSYTSITQIRNAFKSSFCVTCCSCNSIFSDEDRFDQHRCETVPDVTAPVEVKDTYCAGCKSKADDVKVPDVHPDVVFEESRLEPPPLAIDVRRESVSSAEEEADENTNCDDFMSRNSTLDFIGVPEQHTVNSVREDEKEITRLAESLDIKAGKETTPQVEELSDIPKAHQVAASKDVNLRDSIDEHKYEMSPLRIDMDAEPEPLIPENEDITELVSPKAESSISNAQNLSPKATSPSPKATSPSSKAKSSSPKARSPSPKARSPSPNKRSPSPKARSPSPNERSPSPKARIPVTTPLTLESTANLEDDLNTDDEGHSSQNVNDEDVSAASVSKTESPIQSIASVNNTESNWYQETGTKNNKDMQLESETPHQPLTMALMLDDTVASLSVVTIIKECVKTACTTCQYCDNATVIAVNGSHLAAHLLEEHRYMPTKNEDDSNQVIEKLQTGTIDLSNVYMNATFSSHREIIFDGTFACLQCSFTTNLYKELGHHKRRTHHKIVFLCMMCKCNFFFYSQLLCHLCSGAYSTESLLSLSYHCCFCDVDRIPSAFRLMVHLRKVHQACDVCLSRYNDQSELYSHMIKQHKINHLCYKCNLAYRSRDDINKHLFWKHGTESVVCKRCLQKKWPHAYHFCIAASTYTCEECSRTFSKAVALTVHKRAHNNEFPYACEDCDQRCISKIMLASHRRKVHYVTPEPRDDPAVDTPANATETAAVTEDSKPLNDAHNTGDEEVKKRRKKKRSKKSKVNNEKPLLDELPPLNLSSESEEESADEDATSKSEAPLALQPLPVPSSPVRENPPVEISSIPEPVIEDEPPEEITKPPELTPTTPTNGTVDAIEKMLNCLIIEHSYCIPDSIFHSEVTNHSAVSESSDNANKQLSPKPCVKRDKSCCKSITPRKRKRTPRKDSSSSETSSDSDSSSSSCGSNCSCNKSASNCSSSSSSESTTPEKRNKHKQRSSSKRKQTVEEAAPAANSEVSVLCARESELDTEISTSDEDFYDEHPFVVPQSKPKVESPNPAFMSFDTKLTISRNTSGRPSQSSRERKNRKRRKKPKITINLGSIQRNNGASTNVSYPRVVSHVQPSTSTSQLMRSSVYEQWSSDGGATIGAGPSIAHAGLPTNYTLSVNSAGGSAGSGDSSGRLSKRKRTKNRFYGYSSSEEGSGNERMPTTSKKPSNSGKRPPKPRPPFIGIRAKKSLKIIPPKRFATSTPGAPTMIPQQVVPTYTAYRMPSSSSSSSVMPRNFVRPVVTNSSEDSDSDEKRHTLVINLPNLKEKINNSNLGYRAPVPYSNNNESYSNSWTSQHSEGNNQTSSSSSMGPSQSSSKNYCFCQCPYDEVSEMIACDGPGCEIEWFHFECVGIMVPPKGKWFCPNCRKNRENMSRFF